MELWSERQKIRGKIVVLSWVRETCFEESDSLRPKEYHDVEYRHSHVADILQICWETNTSYAVWTTLDLAVNITVVFMVHLRLLDIT